jgi:hypothetical protein
LAQFKTHRPPRPLDSIEQKMIAVPALRPAEERSVLGLRTSLFKTILLAESVRQRVSAIMFGKNDAQT